MQTNARTLKQLELLSFLTGHGINPREIKIRFEDGTLRTLTDVLKAADEVIGIAQLEQLKKWIEEADQANQLFLLPNEADTDGKRNQRQRIVTELINHSIHALFKQGIFFNEKSAEVEEADVPRFDRGTISGV